MMDFQMNLEEFSTKDDEICARNAVEMADY